MASGGNPRKKGKSKRGARSVARAHRRGAKQFKPSDSKVTGVAKPSRIHEPVDTEKLVEGGRATNNAFAAPSAFPAAAATAESSHPTPEQPTEASARIEVNPETGFGPAIEVAPTLDLKRLAEIEQTLLPYQRVALNSPARFTWNCWARQTGKSHTFGLRRLARGLIRRRDQIILSAGERQCREVMQKIRAHCHQLEAKFVEIDPGAFEDAAVRRTEAKLPGGVRILALPANPMTARGFTGDVFLDEFAMHKGDDAILAALFPTLLRGNGELDIASTPRGQGNQFHRLRDSTEFTCTTITLETALSQGLNVDAEAMRRALDDEQIWRQEFCCEFLDEVSSFMPYALIRACQNARLSIEPDGRTLDDRHASVFVGVDVGRVRDATAVWLWRAAGEGFETAGIIVRRGAPFDEQERLIAEILMRPSVRRCCVDATGLGFHLAERLTSRFGDHRVEAVTFTAPLKSQLAGAVRVLAERGLLAIPVDTEVTNDWHSIRRVVTAAGNFRFDAERTAAGHGDRFWAAALGLHAANGSMVSASDAAASFVSGSGTRFGREGVW